MFIYLCIALIASIQYLEPAATISQQKNPPAIPLTYAFDYEASVIFQAISLPLEDVQDSFTLNIFSQIEKNFGTQGLNLSSNQIALIKKTYLYLIFLTKLHLVQHNPSFKLYQSDFANFLQPNNSSLPHIPDTMLLKSSGWNALTITTEDILNSPMWQLFCKIETCDAYSFFYKALNIIHNVEQQTFNYIPHIETSFYDHDYTNLRSINELIRLKIILETTNKNFYLSQCHEWTDSSQDQKSSLEKKIVAFRQTEVYKNTHNIYTLLGIQKNNTATITAQELLTPKQLASPLKEHVWCFFMLNELLTMFYGIITPDTLDNVLTYCSQDNLQPLVFPYTAQDYVYFEELLALKSKTENTHTQSLHPSPPVYKTENTHTPIALGKALHNTQQALSQNVKVQWWPYSEIKHAAEDVYSDVKGAVDDVGDAISEAAQAAAHAIAGAAEGVFGTAVGILGNITGIEAIEEFGTEVQKEAISNLQTATADLQTSINDFANGIKEGLSVEADIDGSLISIITDDKKLGQDFQTMYKQVAGALVNVAAKYTDAIVQTTGNVYTHEIKFGMQFADLVSSAVNTIATGNIANLEANAQTLLNSTVNSITQSFSNLLSAGENVLGAVMQGLGAIINSLTTIFIDISREVTFMVMTAGNIGADILTGQFSGTDFQEAYENAESARNSITNTLDAHRQTINQVMGVAVAIGFTVATEIGSGGAATAEDAAIDEELISGDIAESTTESTEEASSEAGASATNQAGDQAGSTESSDETINNQVTKDEEITNNEPQEENPAQTEEEEEESNWKDRLKKGARLSLKAFGNILNIVFGTFSIISGINSDAQDMLKEQQQTEQLINIWEFVNDNKFSIMQNQHSYLQELRLKQQAAIGNQILALSFIRNISYANINQLTQQISSALSKSFIPLLTPDPNGLRGADIGSSWGIQSPYLDLYPTEGFCTVTTGRPSFPFAQEVAQAPYATQPLAQTSSAKKVPLNNDKQSKKLWFNQKVIGLDLHDTTGSIKQATDPLHVSIDLQIIYMIDADFYTGLYLGGNYYDYTSATYLADLTKNLNFDIDAAHLAKMIVLFRTAANAPLQLGIYEHEGKGWILQEQLPDNMQLASYHTYNIDATLDGENLTISIGIDYDASTKITKNISVTQLENQRTYGIISSGTAIQWNQSSPKASIAINAQARPTYNKTPEIEREKQSKITMNRSMQPIFGSMKLTAISQQAILLGKYLYTTTDTSLHKTSPTNPTDYVVFATHANETISNIGCIPPVISAHKNNTSIIVSVITGNAYDLSGNIVANAGNIWKSYQTNYGPFDATINNYITTTQKQIITALAHITFGSFDLDIINSTALQNGFYIYTCTQTINATDSTGAKIIDYLVAAEISGTELGNSIGMPPTSPNAHGLVSLTTGNLYRKTTSVTAGALPVPISTGYPALSAYENQFNKIDPQILSTIQAAQNAYNAYVTTQQNIPAQPQPITVHTITNTIVTNTNIAPVITGPSLGNGPSVNLSAGPNSQGTIANLQQQAAGSASFQLGTPTGPSVSLGNGP